QCPSLSWRCHQIRVRWSIMMRRFPLFSRSAWRQGIFMETAEQLRAARAMAQWTRAELAQAAGVSDQTIKRLEEMTGGLIASTTTIAASRKALERRGVVFIPGNGGPPGVRFRPTRP